MGITVVTPPTAYPVTLAEAKLHCRVDGTTEDSRIDGLIAAATDYVEKYTGRSIMAQTLRLTLDSFTDAIVLPRGPVQTVSSVKYYDPAGIEQTVPASGYTVDAASDPSWVVRDGDYTWPAILDAVNAVNITFVAGYATVPPSIKHVILLLISQWYDNRSASAEKQMAVLPHAVDALLSNYRSYGF